MLKTGYIQVNYICTCDDNMVRMILCVLHFNLYLLKLTEEMIQKDIWTLRSDNDTVGAKGTQYYLHV